MGFAAIAQAGIWAPLSSWMARRMWDGEHAPVEHTASAKVSPLRLLPRYKDMGEARGFVTPTLSSDASPARQQRPSTLRVVRVVEGRQNAQYAGRMVISGRMADVCAELERLAPY